MQHLSVTDSNRIVASSEELCEAVGGALLESELPAKHHDLAGQCAAYLYASGWLERQTEVCGDVAGWADRDELIRQREDEAVRELQTAGIVPSGFVWMFFWQFVIGPYIGALVRKWMLG